MGYKILGFVVWKGAKLYLRRRLHGLLPSRKVTSAGIVAIAVVGLAVAAARRDAASS